jgi:hypothetical protein
MLWLIATILIVLWLGTVTLYTINGFAHIFLLVACIMILLKQIKCPKNILTRSSKSNRFELIIGKNQTDKLDRQ